jgi:hypothetical protein
VAERDDQQRRPGGPEEGADRRLRIGETDARVVGLPLEWFRTRTPGDTRWLRHPVRWARWRRQVRRLGPYAPEFDYPGASGK